MLYGAFTVGMKRCDAMKVEGLSERERNVLSCLLEGLSNDEIGLMLDITPRTVHKHVQRVLCYLGVETRGEAIAVMHRVAQNKLNGTWS